jgi:hypothetical protein
MVRRKSRGDKPTRDVSVIVKTLTNDDGKKSALLRVLNPFWKDKTGGAILPIKIAGISNPSFGLDVGRHAEP